MSDASGLAADHRAIADDLVARAYVLQLRRVAAALTPALAEMVRDRIFSATEVQVIDGYLRALLATAQALSMKYLLVGRAEGPLRRALTIDIDDSGFPVWQEIAQTAADAAQAGEELARSPTAAAIKDDMIRQIVGDLTHPTRLQYALSQRMYYESLAAGGLFWPQMHPQALGLGQQGNRRRWLIHWGVYDSRQNLPVVYLMDCDDTGRRPLPDDARRWPEARAHLLAQSVGALQLLTIAQGFDADFDTLHPQRLRRLTLGPIHSREFTVQEGPIRQVLDDARAEPGQDWALALSVEDLVSDRAEMESSGLFTVTERQIWRIDPLDRHGAGQGTTAAQRLLVIPQRPYQALARLDPPGFRGIRKYVPGPDGRVLGFG
ncbi:hypothetical protein [Paracoccus luteus]|uniref:hypothetical protein n=1 Tax=Paracoccus luteus TaxID=2508543 RepID=UPI0010702D45|nr:hypothetical protein [Paracoccus luteus]